MGNLESQYTPEPTCEHDEVGGKPAGTRVVRSMVSIFAEDERLIARTPSELNPSSLTVPEISISSQVAPLSSENRM